MVRIHVGQPFDALRLLMACGRQVPGIRELFGALRLRRLALSLSNGLARLPPDIDRHSTRFACSWPAAGKSQASVSSLGVA
jgi:hypothetical protein